ncbi:hypothetical protein L6452_06167 [Arctium lappa]|uniref:Uncharacterized protein n=1 Tax=Arctium lappa TaxID=4217 RepID=A0ACB9EIV4_ARCLA|nr:hypothetical protein L6452_06167 [Arctium lappa]
MYFKEVDCNAHPTYPLDTIMKADLVDFKTTMIKSFIEITAKFVAQSKMAASAPVLLNVTTTTSTTTFVEVVNVSSSNSAKTSDSGSNTFFGPYVVDVEPVNAMKIASAVTKSHTKKKLPFGAPAKPNLLRNIPRVPKFIGPPRKRLNIKTKLVVDVPAQFEPKSKKPIIATRSPKAKSPTAPSSTPTTETTPSGPKASTNAP